MLIKVNEASGPALDWMVAKCEGRHELAPFWVDDDKYGNHIERPFSPSTDWAQGGPIIEREKIDCIANPNGKNVWIGQLYATKLAENKIVRTYAPTPLIAAMRCYVASKLGSKADIPDELSTN